MRQIHAEQIRQLARSRDWWRRRWERQVDENELRQQNAALLMVALRARDVWGSWGRVDSKLEALGHALAEPAAQELVTAALAQGESNQGGWQ